MIGSCGAGSQKFCPVVLSRLAPDVVALLVYLLPSTVQQHKQHNAPVSAEESLISRTSPHRQRVKTERKQKRPSCPILRNITTTSKDGCLSFILAFRSPLILGNSIGRQRWTGDVPQPLDDPSQCCLIWKGLSSPLYLPMRQFSARSLSAWSTFDYSARQLGWAHIVRPLRIAQDGFGASKDPSFQ